MCALNDHYNKSVTARYSEGLLFWRFVIPKVGYSEGLVIPKVGYSEGLLFWRFVNPKMK